MSARTLRRAAERKALKLARKAGFPIPQSPQAVEPEAITAAVAQEEEAIALNTDSRCETEQEPARPSGDPSDTVPVLRGAARESITSKHEIPLARLTANRSNAQFSTGPKSPATKSVSAQNHATHGLARHSKGTFKLLSSENLADFESSKQSLLDEHLPATETEWILVSGMAESHWLAQRAQRLQDTCMDPDTGVITDDKMFSLYLRYQTTHNRAFHKSLNDLFKLRAEKRRAEFGFEAQKRKEEESRVKSERHEMKKQSHSADLVKKDAEIRHQIGVNAAHQTQSYLTIRGFCEKFEEELAHHSLPKEQTPVATKAA